MAQCIIYARVSTRQQALGHGIIRQIECCQQRAKRDGLWVCGIYVDVCSGAGSMHNRRMAIAEAKYRVCPILVESVDRWTRKGDDDSLNDDALELVFCSELQAEFEKKVMTALRIFKQQEATDGR